ncbi:MAG: hypothetical protein Q9227_005791 [Pyrenula ochraceoflavens]
MTLPRPLGKQTRLVKKRLKDVGTQWSPPIEPKQNLIRRKPVPGPPHSSAHPTQSPDSQSQSQAATAISNLHVTGSKRGSSPTPPLDPPNAPDPHVTPASQSPAKPSETPAGSTPNKRARGASPAATLMPLSYSEASLPDLVILISSMLMELIRHNDSIPLANGHLTRFHSRAPPGISVRDYLQRLTQHATLSQPILLSMVYYIDRLCALYPAFTINSLTVHRFLIASATVASKGLSDSFWTNKTYAKVGGVSLKELALLELEFLCRLEWRIVPKPETLVEYYHSLVEQTPGYEIDITGKLELEREEQEERERKEKERKDMERLEKEWEKRETERLERESMDRQRASSSRRESPASGGASGVSSQRQSPSSSSSSRQRRSPPPL